MKITVGNKALFLNPVSRNILQIAENESALIAPDKEFYHYDTENGAVAGQIEATAYADTIAVHTYYADFTVFFADGKAVITADEANYFSRSASSEGKSRLNGGRYGDNLASKFVFADTCWGVRMLTDGVLDLTEAGRLTLEYSGEANLVLYTGRPFEMLALDNKVAGCRIIPAVTDYAPNSNAVSETVLPVDEAIIARHPVHFDCFSDKTHGSLDNGGFYTKLRYRLIPYIHSQVIESRKNGMPLVRPLAFTYYDANSAKATNEYMFGRDILIAAEGEVWLPLGDNWMNYTTGRFYAGGQYIKEEISDGMDGLIYVRGGAVIPMSKFDNHIEYSSELVLREVPGGKDSFAFYESDGREQPVDGAKLNKTIISAYQDEKGFLVRMGERMGRNSWMTEKRTWIAEMSQCVTITGTYVNCRDAENYIREDGICVVKCGEPWLINIRYRMK